MTSSSVQAYITLWAIDRSSCLLSIVTETLQSTSRKTLPAAIPDMIFGKKSFNPDTDVPDLKGKVFLVTGGMCSVHYRQLGCMDTNF